MADKVNIIVPRFKGFKKEITLFEGIEDMTPVKIILPDPPNKNKVINFNRPTSAQKWERIPLPKSFLKYTSYGKENIYNSLTLEEHKFIQDEYKKLDEGFWFLNNGVMTYITGHHYFFLNWWRIDIGYPKYRDVNRRYFLHWDKIEKDPNCYGMIEMTRRRDGKSFRAGCIAYARTFSYANRYAGIQSKTNEDAAKMFQKAIASPWKKLPFFFQPNFDNSNNPREELRFFIPTTRGRASQERLSREEALESWIQSRASVVTAFDGEKLHSYIGDEEGKTVEVDVSERWDVVKMCMEEDGIIIGKAVHTSTVEEMEKMGGKNFKEIWDGSDPDPNKKNPDGSPYMDELGRTPSGLHRHFTPAYDGYDVDEYGNSLIETSIARLQKERDGAKSNPQKLTRLKRKKPFTIKECFRSAGKECHFNIEIIDSRLEEFTFNNPYVSYGNFEWKDNKKDTTVEFRPCNKDKARFIVSYLFENPFEANRQLVRNNVKCPNNTTFGIAGGDPFKYKIVKSGQGSKGTGAVFMHHNIMRDPPEVDVSKWTTNRFCCTYSYDKRDKAVYIDDLIKMCVYYGIYMFPEINVDLIWDGFDQRGYGGYLYYERDKGRVSKTPGAATTNDKFKESMFAEFDAYIENHGMREVHSEVLEAAREVDMQDLSPHDLFVACGYALLGAKKSFKAPQVKRSSSKPLFQTFVVK